LEGSGELPAGNADARGHSFPEVLVRARNAAFCRVAKAYRLSPVYCKLLF
jgi:hypothetical protein